MSHAVMFHFNVPAWVGVPDESTMDAFMPMPIAWDGDRTCASNACAYGRAIVDHFFPDPAQPPAATLYCAQTTCRRERDYMDLDDLLSGLKPSCSRADWKGFENYVGVPWLARTTHPVDLLYMFYAQHHHRGALAWPEVLMRRYMRVVPGCDVHYYEPGIRGGTRGIAVIKRVVMAQLVVEHIHYSHRIMVKGHYYDAACMRSTLLAAQEFWEDIRYAGARKVQACWRGFRVRKVVRHDPKNRLGRHLALRQYLELVKGCSS